MGPRIDVLWPINPAPEIREIQFSHEFCRRTTQDLLKGADLVDSWIDYRNGDLLQGYLIQTKGDGILVVSDPEIVISAVALARMVASLGDGVSSCGPVYNVTEFPKQRVALSAPYLNVSTYLEIAEQVSKGNEGAPAPTVEMDPGCILYHRELLGTLKGRTPIDEIHKVLEDTRGFKAAVQKGALVHRFGNYYEGERDDLVLLVPPSAMRILDIGCARGGYGKRLKQLRPDVHLVCIEANPIMAECARRYYDEVLTAAIEGADISSSFDLINCGDVLEHLDDPWSALHRFAGLLRKGGYLVLSVPNMGHWSIAKDLIAGYFDYLPVGLTCVSHIRWFTESTVRTALLRAGFSIDLVQREQLPATPEGEAFIQKLCAAGIANEASLRTNEIIIRAVKM